MTACVFFRCNLWLFVWNGANIVLIDLSVGNGLILSAKFYISCGRHKCFPYIMAMGIL